MKKQTRVLPILLALILLISSIPMTAQAATKSYIAEPTTFKITMDGIGITVRNYEIDYRSTLYVKVRDIACAFNETDKKFNVAYNSKKNTLTLTPGKRYVEIGSENEKRTSKSESDKAYDKSTKLYVGSKKQSAKVYTINNEQYVALTSLAKLIDFSVKKSKSTYKIDTTKGYSDADTNTGSSIQSPSLLVPSDSTGLLKNPFPNAALISKPKTVDDCKHILEYLVINNLVDYSFYTKVSYKDAIKEGGLIDLLKKACNESYTPELYRGAIGSTEVYVYEHGSGTKVRILFKGYNEQRDDTLMKLNKDYFVMTQAVVQGLIDSGKITEGMSDYDKAYAVYTWIAENVKYEDDLGNGVEHSGYSAIVNKKAVCSGYTALYNLMCRFVGLYDIQGMSGTSKATGVGHQWSAQVLDGIKVLTDSTWGACYFRDGSPIDTYFAKSTKFFKTEHVWDTEEYSDWNTAQGIESPTSEDDGLGDDVTNEDDGLGDNVTDTEE